MSKVLKPKDKGSFGWLLWKILGGPEIDRRLAAERLRITPAWLTQILHHSRDENFPNLGKVTRRYVLKKNWRNILAQHYAEAWKVSRDEFEDRVQQQPVGPVPKPTSKTREPKDKGSFGWILWRIMDGPKMNTRLAARRLGIRPSSLSSILHHSRDTASSSGKISQRYIRDKNWRAILEKYYREAWRVEGGEFEVRVLQQPSGSSSEPADKTSLGWLVWAVLDGENINVEEAAKRLNDIKPRNLRRIIDGRNKITQAFLKKNNWLELLHQHYSDNFTLAHQIEFEERARRLPRNNGNQRIRLKQEKTEGAHTSPLLNQASFYNAAYGLIRRHIIHSASTAVEKGVEVGNAFSSAARWFSRLKGGAVWSKSEQFRELDAHLTPRLAAEAGIKGSGDLQKRLKNGCALDISAEMFLAVHYLLAAVEYEGRSQLQRAEGLLRHAPTDRQLDRWAAILAPQMAA